MQDIEQDQETKYGPFLFIGNRLWLDFINTSFEDKGKQIDFISHFEALREWLAAAGALEASERKTVATWSRPEQEEVTRYALGLRTALRQIAERVAQSEEVDETALARVNETLRSQKSHLLLTKTPMGYRKTACREWVDKIALLAPLAASVADTLAGDDLAHLRKCENPMCLLYFYDTSKNHARRWCSMELCGNRSKVAAHYERSRHLLPDG